MAERGNSMSRRNSATLMQAEEVLGLPLPCDDAVIALEEAISALEEE